MSLITHLLQLLIVVGFYHDWIWSYWLYNILTIFGIGILLLGCYGVVQGVNYQAVLDAKKAMEKRTISSIITWIFFIITGILLFSSGSIATLCVWGIGVLLSIMFRVLVYQYAKIIENKNAAK